MFELKKKFSISYQKYPKIEFSSSDFHDFGRFRHFSGVRGQRKKVTDLGREFSYFVFISHLLRDNLMPYGNLRIFRSPESTLLVVKNRLRKVWDRFSTIRGQPKFLTIRTFFQYNMAYLFPEESLDSVKTVEREGFLVRKSCFYEIKHHRRSKVRSELPIRILMR